MRQRDGTLVQMLGGAAALWKTPHGFQAGNGPDGNEFSKAARLWRTPDAPSPGGGVRTHTTSAGKNHQLMLAEQAQLWMTPLASIAARTWPSPMSRDHKGGNGRAQFVRTDGRTDGRTFRFTAGLPDIVKMFSSRPARPTRAGQPSSPSDLTSLRLCLALWIAEQLKRNSADPCEALRRAATGESAGVQLEPLPQALLPLFRRNRLNPMFVNWLMGWPFIWTRAEPISFAARETASFRCKLQQQLSSLFGEP